MRATLESHGNRGPGFDTVRLIAATAVMLHHALGIEIDIVRDDVIFQFSDGYTHLGLLAVAVFFSISGFLVTPGLVKTGNVLEYLSRRFMRIMPLLFCVVVLTAFVLGPLLTSLSPGEYYTHPDTWAYLRNITTSLRLDLPGVVNHAGSSGVNGPLWTLRYEWLCYIIIALTSLAFFLRARFAFLAFWLATVIAFPMIYGFAEAEEGIGQVGRLLYLFGYFGAGVTIFLYSDIIRWSPRWMLAASLALVTTLHFGLAHYFAPFLVSYLAIGFGLVAMPWSRMLSRADFSYGVYLTHSLVLTVLMNIYPFQSSLVLFAVCLPVSFAVAGLTWTFIEKPALTHKSLPAMLVRNLLDRVPFGSVLLTRLDPPRPSTPASS